MKFRINELLQHFNMTQAELSKRIGLNNTVTINRLAGNHVKPSFDIIVKILGAFPEINANWLLTGEGEMMKGKDKENIIPVNMEMDKDELLRYLLDEIKDKRKDCSELRTEIFLLKQELALIKEESKKKEANSEMPT